MSTLTEKVARFDVVIVLLGLPVSAFLSHLCRGWDIVISQLIELCLGCMVK
ncbi:hypothetical protein RU86_GL000209 [Lactococcus piscium]|uniref:Uncharacterized protein n=1 Tax=Pseudolactococcus piscium TaxID=1364 RepID=A0A2A5RZD5_9LACT|nr:hypothetical protein RU86_GL000209 [Lactococcus piscium]